MNDVDEEEVRPALARIRLRFSVLALLLFVATVSSLLSWLVQPKRVVATALFQVESASPTIFGETAAPLSKRDFEKVQNTQRALLRSDFFLAAVVRSPEIASLSIFEKSDPAVWLREHLDVTFSEKEDVLAISLRGTEAQSKDLIQLTDAVAKAYEHEVETQSRQRRLGTRDFLARHLESLNREIKQRVDTYLEIARESGSFIPHRDNDLQRLDTTQLVRGAATLQRELAIEADPDNTNHDSDSQHVKELRDRLKTLMDELKTRIEGRPFPERLERNLEQLQRVANDMAVKIEKLDVEASRSDRIRQLQHTTISDD